jgi:hypothetical protein
MLAIALPWLGGTLVLHALPALPGAGWCVPLALLVLAVARAPRTRVAAAVLATVGAFAYTA